MLIEFSVGNFRSYKDITTLSMVAANLPSEEIDQFSKDLIQHGKLSVLRTAAIFGANASGKSNLIKAMTFFKQFVVSSSMESQVGTLTGVEPFLLSTETIDEPSFFQIIFMIEGVKFRYGFELTPEKVVSEWLYRTISRETPLFTRDMDTIRTSSSFKEGKTRKHLTRPNALLLSVVAQFNGKLSGQIIEWIKGCFNIISGIQDTDYSGFTHRRFETDPAFKKCISTLLQFSDLGIEDVKIQNIPLSEAGIPDDVRDSFIKELSKTANREVRLTEVMSLNVETMHSIYNKDKEKVNSTAFDLNHHESAGTQKLYNLSGPILDTLQNGTLLIIDELDTRLHPVLLKTIVALFNSKRTNPNNAQLVFCSHSASLMTTKTSPSGSDMVH